MDCGISHLRRDLGPVRDCTKAPYHAGIMLPKTIDRALQNLRRGLIRYVDSRCLLEGPARREAFRLARWVPDTTCAQQPNAEAPQGRNVTSVITCVDQPKQGYAGPIANM